ncbi:MAG: serine/threonine protein kinase [Bdellovibrio sp.]|nr:serine/threonine protein kinase [Bdellovibrio sp.]
MRICPNCLKETDQEICPIDGFQTTERKNLKMKVADPFVGQVFLNRYKIEKIIGEGGMGKVYLARQISVNRDVAIKILSPNNPDSEKDIIRFQREAVTVGQLQHPNTVKLYDYGETEFGGLFMAMEYIQGKTIRDCIKAGRKFSVDDVCSITKQILKSLREAHDHGIIHRDLKSSNIMLTENFGERDFVKVLDFGIAKNIYHSKEDSSLTATGFVVGTPTYMSPEQILGLNVDGRSDLYSLGLIMYEMLTHRKPPKAKNRSELLDTRPNPDFLRFDDLPQTDKSKTLYSLVSKSLEKIAAKRPESAATFLSMIEKMDQTGPAIVLPEPKKEMAPPPRMKPPQKTKKKLGAFFPLIIICALLAVIAMRYVKRHVQTKNEINAELISPVSENSQIVMHTGTPAPIVIPTLIPTFTPIPTRVPTLASTPLPPKDEFLTVQTDINLDFAKNLQNLSLKIDGPLDFFVEISEVNSPAFGTQIEINPNSKNAHIPILIRAKQPCGFMLSLIQTNATGNLVLAKGMGHMGILASDGRVPINSATTFLTNYALKQNKLENLSFRCIIDPYTYLFETLRQKYEANLWLLPQKILEEEVTAKAHIFSTAPSCQTMPHEKGTKLIPVTLSIEIDPLKLQTGSTLKLKIMREDSFYLPLKHLNSKAANLDLTPELDFTIKSNDKFYTLRFFTVLPEGPEFGNVEIHHNGQNILSGIINLRRSEQGLQTEINSKTTLFTRSLELNDYELACLMHHFEKFGPVIPGEGGCKRPYANQKRDTTKFRVSSNTLSKNSLLQREDLLFIPIKIDSTNHEIEFNNHFGPAWTRLIIPENSQAPLSTIFNIRDVMIKDDGVLISPLGNLIITKILENDSLNQYDLECLNFQFNELMIVATSTFRLSPETSTNILIPEWQEHFKMLKQNMPCKKR